MNSFLDKNININGNRAQDEIWPASEIDQVAAKLP